MFISELHLRDFRNYSRADVSFGEGLTVLVGSNAQGKSNLLEAVHIAATGRSPRTTAVSELVQFGADRAYIRAVICGRGARVVEVVLGRGMEEKAIKVDGVPTGRGGLAGKLAVVLAGPDDGRIICGPSAARRRFLDAALSQLSASYYFVLARYRRVVEQRNRLLGEVRAGAVLEAWDAQLIELGASIVERRRRFVKRWSARASERHARIMPCENLKIEYASVAVEGEERAALERALALSRVEELRRGITLVGPHRDDVIFQLDGVDLRAYGSRGQHHTVALSLRLAEADVLRDEFGEWPVLLLDDVIGGLDPERQEMLLRESVGPQVFLTHTTIPPSPMPMHVMRIHGGAIIEGSHVRP